MDNSISWEELDRIMKAPNDTLTDEELEVKRSRLWFLADDLLRDGVEDIATKCEIEAFDCLKELDRRHGIVRTYNVPKWPPEPKPKKRTFKRRFRRRKTNRR